MTRKHLVVLVTVTALWTAPVPARAAVGVSVTADPTWGTDVTADNKAARVLTVVANGGRIYLGGDFTAVSPPGSKDPAALVPREYLAAFGDGGTTLADWNPRADGEVRALLASPDGHRIYAGGMFKHIGGRPATRLAAIDATTGALDPTFSPPEVDGVVRALGLSPDGSVLYVGGDFSALTAADGSVESRPHLAALDAATGRLAPWLPPDDTGGRYYGQTGVKDETRPGGVHAIAPSADGTTVHVGGTFLSFGGRSGLVSLDAATGQPTPWQAKVDRPIYGLTRGHDGHTFYAAAGGAGGRLYAFRPHGPPEGVWQVKTDGDNMAVVETETTVYLIGHYDYIVDQKSDCYRYCPDGIYRRHLSAFDHNGKLEDWNPEANTSTGPYAAAAAAAHLFVVGEFTKIGGVRHVGFAAFPGTP
jgi:outer membrane protein assembly factor BamB